MEHTISSPDNNGQFSRKQQLLRAQLEAQCHVIEQLMHIGNTPGISIAVLCDNEQVFEKGYGYSNVRDKTPAVASTIYPIASITKGFTAAACGLLVADDKLSWGKQTSFFSFIEYKIRS